MVGDSMHSSRSAWRHYGPYVAFVAALTGTLGSLYYSEIASFVPCTLCWYQRILMYPLVLITLVGIIKQDEGVPGYVLPFSLAGIAVSTYHYLIQAGIVNHSAACTVGVPCGLRYVTYFGFVAIPLLALVSFAIISGVMFISAWNAYRLDSAACPEHV
jgi:disulfide bond formation protein DsbB